MAFVPYGPTSIWNRPMSEQTNPRLLAGSAAMVSTAEQGDDRQVWVPAAGSGYDEGHPVYVATAGDPLVNVHCTTYCSRAYPAQVRIPAKARPADGGDGHITVVQPDGSEFDTWATTRPAGDWKPGDMLTAMNAVTCGNFSSGSGFLGTDGASTVGDACLAGGLVRATEIKAGAINHALFATVDCATTAYYVYPANQPFDDQCSGPGTHVPNGAHVWLDLDDAQIAALPAQGWEKTILRALHHYGAYVGDSSIGGARAHGLIAPFWEDDAQYAAYGTPNPMAVWAKAQGWNPVTVHAQNPGDPNQHDTTWYTFSDSWNPLLSVGGWAAHLRIVDPCYAQGTC